MFQACLLDPLAALLLAFATPVVAEETRRITCLYDAFGPPSELVKDWGFAAVMSHRHGGHTSALGFAVFQDRFDRAGLGDVIALP